MEDNIKMDRIEIGC